MLKSINEIIAIIDSGIGGASILKQLINKHHCGNFIYFADNLYMPYGNKNKTWLKNRVNKIINELRQKYSVKQVIIACNTASASINNKTNNDIIKMEFLPNKTYYATRLTKRNLPHLHVIADNTLAKLIEKNINNKNKLENIVKRHIKTHGLYNHNEVVLGCTHYELIMPMFEKLCKQTKVINNSSFMIDKIKVQESEHANVVIFLSKKDIELENKILSILKEEN